MNKLARCGTAETVSRDHYERIRFQNADKLVDRCNQQDASIGFSICFV